MARFSDVFGPKSQKVLGTFTAGDLEIDSTTLSVDATNDRVGMGLTDPKTRLTVEGAVTLKEQSAADSDTAAYGQIWVKDEAPCELYFTTDAGTDIQLTDGTSVAGGGTASSDSSLILHMQMFT